MEIFVLLLVLLIDFFITAFGVWVITAVINTFTSAVIVFSWSLAFVVWVVIKIIKLIS